MYWFVQQFITDGMNADYSTYLGCQKIILMAKNEREVLIAGSNCGTSEVVYYLPQSNDEAMIQYLVKVFLLPKGNN